MQEKNKKGEMNMHTNKITFKNYEATKKEFGHISTWARWNEEAKDFTTRNFDKDAAIRNELIIANTKEEFEEKQLGDVLHGEVVILGLNFSCPKAPVKNANPILQILNKYKDEKYNRKRYKELVKLVEEQKKFTFFNMYGPAARNYAEGFIKSDILHGAYMTDFIKFVEEDGELLPAGIPHSNSGSNVVTKHLREEHIHLQAEGLKKEFDLLGIKPKVIVAASSKLNREKVRQAISDALGYRPHFEQLHHYTLGGSSYSKKGYESKEEMYRSEIMKISQNIESIV